MDDLKEMLGVVGSIVCLILFVVFIGGICLFGMNSCYHQFERYSAENRYKTYEKTELADIRVKEISGKKALAEAEWNKKIQIADANAKAEAAKSLAQVEIERAKGVAEANRIIGQSLQNNEGYLRYLWIQGLQNNSNSTIYVPTEAGLPILEASRLNKNG